MTTMCPICGKQSTEAERPFCSNRCADVDLGRWFNEGYHVPASAPEFDEEADEPPG